MRFPLRSAAAVLAAALLASCLGDTPTAPIGTPIDCSSLARGLDTASGLITTPSGLRYRDVRVGTGTDSVRAGSVVGVYYAGCLVGGAVFDERLDNRFPFEFVVGTNPLSVIPGFDEGVRGMRRGGSRQIVIPANLGYGAQANGPIPANSTLIFTVEAFVVR